MNVIKGVIEPTVQNNSFVGEPPSEPNPVAVQSPIVNGVTVQ